MTLEESQQSIVATCEEIKQLLLEKNAKYGNSVHNPRRIFSRASPEAAIKVRIDDKLARIEQSGGKLTDTDEDTLKDLIGYLILLRAYQTHFGPQATTGSPNAPK